MHRLYLLVHSKLDYCGIAILTMGSFVPWLYYGFYCQFFAKIFYLVAILLLGKPPYALSPSDVWGFPAVHLNICVILNFFPHSFICSLIRSCQERLLLWCRCGTSFQPLNTAIYAQVDDARGIMQVCWCLLDAFSHLYKKVCPSVGPSVHPSVGLSVRRSVGHTRVEFLRNGPNLNKIASGIRTYAI